VESYRNARAPVIYEGGTGDPCDHAGGLCVGVSAGQADKQDVPSWPFEADEE
jgi:hypothetical protein